MRSHELAKILLAHKDLPISTHANNHTTPHTPSGGDIRVCLSSMGIFNEARIVIGNISHRDFSGNGAFVIKALEGEPITYVRQPAYKEEIELFSDDFLAKI